MRLMILVFLAVLALSPQSEAANRMRKPVRQPVRYVTPQQSPLNSNPTSAAAQTHTLVSHEATDALDELNAQRAARGLRPYLRDPNLTLGAINVAKFRAERLIAGHSVNDFLGLPVGTTAVAAGCAAWPVGLGFGACGVYDRYTFCGAASVMGRDGKLYHHAFYR